MKKFLFLIIGIIWLVPSFANHIAGGELFYQYIGPSGTGNKSVYRLTMRLFRDCNSTGQVLNGETVRIGIYNSGSGSLAKIKTLPIQPPVNSIQLNTSAIPCLVNAPNVCFQIGIFTDTVHLNNTDDGYTLTWVRCCRSDGIVNLNQSSGAGATYSTTIPGKTLLPTGNNSSPQFLIKDTALVCKDKTFTLNFGAIDQDGDSLSYSFCDAFGGGTSTNPIPDPSPTLNLPTLFYRSPYSGSSPLGSKVSINTSTGIISGIAPGAGRYVISVCVTEKRNGKIINTHRKDFILEVGNCDFAAAEPLPNIGSPYIPFSYDFISCKSFTINFKNRNTSNLITNYAWDFGVPGTNTDTSTKASPSFTYPDTGVYTIKLVVKASNTCVDSNTVRIAIYPGFKGDYTVSGSCFKNPFKFRDISTTNFGFINSYKWDFGEEVLNTDTSSLKNPDYKYATAGVRNVRLYVTSNKGCIDTVIKPVDVRTIPLLILPFHDTLICSVDTLQLMAQGAGTFTWTPTYNLIGSTSPTPLVFPKDTTTYVVTMLEDGCTAVDSIKVNVVDFVTVDAGRDTLICSRDVIQLRPDSYGLQYEWTPVKHIVGDPNVKNPFVSPIFDDRNRKDSIVTYSVTARVGKCFASDQVNVKAVRYPFVNAGPDTSICYGNSVMLNATILGSSFKWFPTYALANLNTLSPVASPKNTTTYFLIVTDTIGCPKESYDTVIVNVIPPIIAFAGNDTNIVANQLLQLNATGAINYEWTPSFGLNNPFIPNPVANLGASVDSIIYTVKASTPEGCFGIDKIKVVVFKTPPDIFVPSAFTPNSDGKNDVLKPIAVGLKRLNYFRVFNRWGQMLYSTSSVGQGWDGTFGGKEQGTGTYVYMAEAEDYLGKILQRKGTAVLIR